MKRPKLARIPESVEEAASWYMHYVSPFALIAAFFVDTLFLVRHIDSLQTTLVLSFYLLVASAMSLLILLIRGGRLRHSLLVTYLPFFPVVSQFAFGGLFMAFLSLYGRSASISLSWIFVAGMIVLLIANERFVTLYQRLSFQVATLFFTLLAFLAFYLPLVVHAIGIPVFLLSGAIAIALTACFLLVVYFAVPIFLREERFIVLRALLVVYLSWNLLYFSNIIPPLPLALKESGIFHAVTREGDAYLLTAEKKEWYEAYLPWRKEVYHRAPGESVYAYTAIYAPKDISTPITYEWQHYATTTREWATRAEISFIVRGGREGGYRAYSVKAVPEVGEWRVNVLLGDGRLLGRTAFTVVEASSSVSVIEEIR